jgi:hypothetical protein
MRKLKYITSLGAACLLALTGMAKENVPNGSANPSKTYSNNKLMKYAADCEPATARVDLDINNVRAKILNGGDMWWDLSNARYEVPKVTDLNAVRKNSLFAGAIWIGGEDEGVLKLAAMTYRQSGSDFWPGPLDTVTANTNSTRCEQYDKIYEVKRGQLEKHIEVFEANGGVVPTGDIPDGIKNWPGNGNGLNEPEFLAPFFDQNKDGIYSPEEGDYPVLQNDCRGIGVLDENNGPADQPDQMLWFVYNDRGNIHSETQGQAIGLEMQTTAFAYATNDEINNMTFYTTRIINRGSSQLSNTYFGQWVDPDLGNFSDDYVGCDVDLSLGYCYNGDDNDEGILGYGLNPPSIGVDFFEGPKKDTVIDGVSQQFELGMSKFVYYDNDFTNFGNPQSPIHYYNYLRGKWKNGDCLTWDKANARTGSECTDYIFPGTTDPEHQGEEWTETTAGNTPADRRFLQTSGPFTLKPGAVNKITVGVVWARASSGGATGSLELLKAGSRKAQELFDNCFDILDGPDAPIVEVQELNKEVILMFTNTKSDKVEEYKEVIKTDGEEREYVFQGYRVYQLKNSTIGTGDLNEIDKAREIFLCDLKDSITRLVNSPFDESLGQPLPRLMVDGPNKGLIHSLSITEDAFATGSNKSLVNNKTYYFMVLSYSALPGHPSVEYLAGRKIEQFSVTPHQPEPRLGGVKLNGNYGDGPKLVRLEGTGNGGQNLELTQESIDYILANNFMPNPEYAIGKGPVKIKIVDPLKVPRGNFEIILREQPLPLNPNVRREGMVAENSSWMLINLSTNDTVFSDYKLDYENEQLVTAVSTNDVLKDWGMSVTVKQVTHPGDPLDLENGFIDWSVTWEDNSKQWLTALQDQDGRSFLNWIRSGRVGGNVAEKDYSIHDYYKSQTDATDQFEIYEKIWDGRIAPYRLASRNIYSADVTTAPSLPANGVQGPAFNGTRIASDWHDLENLASVDIVLTKDESKWTQCLVLEMGEDENLNEGGVQKFAVRDHASLNKDGSYSTSEKGRSWFPGYAINVETGERLNIIMGEDSYQGGNNGRDMKWNPTDDNGFYGSGYVAWGGRHYIYVMGAYKGTRSIYTDGPRYDGGAAYLAALNASTPATYGRDLNNKVLYQAMWLIPSYMANGYKMDVNSNNMPVPPTELSFKLRVKKPYQELEIEAGSTNDNNPRYSFDTKAVYTELGKEFATSALDQIRVVPNPYYAFSAYENNPVENKVQITNLPEKCVVSIYTVDGSLVRKIAKDDPSTWIVWDLKNNAKVPIASGNYIIHVDGGDAGEKVIKWMGMMRALDLDSF